MSRNSGSRMAGPCPYCGQRYKLTNFMRRHDPAKDDQGRFLTDTHLRACWRKLASASPKRALLDGRRVPELADPVLLPLHTRAPEKWLAVDWETGELWRGSAAGWLRAPLEDRAALQRLLALLAGDPDA